MCKEENINRVILSLVDPTVNKCTPQFNVHEASLPFFFSLQNVMSVFTLLYFAEYNKIMNYFSPWYRIYLHIISILYLFLCYIISILGKFTRVDIAKRIINK